MANVFLSYRRDDSAAYAGRVYDRLVARFGADQVFMDIDRIAPGENFVDAINRHVVESSAVLVLIGPRWADARGRSGQRRLHEVGDFVCLEVGAALQSAVRVVPVLVGGATMPRAQELPEVLRPLVALQALEISDGRFHYDVGRLIDAIEPVHERSATMRTLVAARSTASRPHSVFAGHVTKARMLWFGSAAMIAAMAALLWSRQPPPASASLPTKAKPGAQPPQPAPRDTTTTPAVLHIKDTFPGDSSYSDAMRTLVTRLNTASGGQPLFLLVPSSGNATQANAVQALSRGSIEGASLPAAALGGLDEAFFVLDGPPFGPDVPAYGRWRRSAAVLAVADKMYAAQGLKGLSCAVVPGVDLWSRTRLARTSDLRGKKLRAYGLRARIYKAAGADVVSMPTSEVRAALANGTLDAADIPDVATAAQFHVQEAAPYAYVTPLTRAIGLDLVFRRRVWDAIDDTTRQRIETSCMENMASTVTTQLRKVSTSWDTLRSRGAQVSALPDPIVADLREGWLRVQAGLASNPAVPSLVDVSAKPP